MADRILFSPDDVDFSLLKEEDFTSIHSFKCGVEEIDDFFHTEVRLCAKYHYLFPYKCVLRSTGEIVGLFTLANDVVLLEYEDKIEYLDYRHEYSDIFLRHTSYPAINIGHLAVKYDLQSRGIGQLIVNFVAASFANQTISGCQFVTVDALNVPRTIDFYQLKLGFEFLTLNDLGHHTRRMYLGIFPE